MDHPSVKAANHTCDNLTGQHYPKHRPLQSLLHLVVEKTCYCKCEGFALRSTSDIDTQLGHLAAMMSNQPESTNQPKPEKPLRSAELFGKRKRIEIDHRGEIYRLQITRQGKLILTK